MNRFNKEGYKDLTAYEALSKIAKEEKIALKREEKTYKPLVFICSPYAGDIEGNVMRAKRYGRFAVSKKVIPIIPHLMYPQFLFDDDLGERKLGLEMGLVLLTKCKEIWVFGDRESDGMRTEIIKAKKREMKIRCFTISCEEVKIDDE